MGQTAPKRSRIGIVGSFLLASLASCAGMRLLVRSHPQFTTSVFAFIWLTVGVMVSWQALRRWRRIHPLACAAVVGLFSGWGGAGLYMLLVAALLGGSPASMSSRSAPPEVAEPAGYTVVRSTVAPQVALGQILFQVISNWNYPASFHWQIRATDHADQMILDGIEAAERINRIQLDNFRRQIEESWPIDLWRRQNVK